MKIKKFEDQSIKYLSDDVFVNNILELIVEMYEIIRCPSLPTMKAFSVAHLILV